MSSSSEDAENDSNVDVHTRPPKGRFEASDLVILLPNQGQRLHGLILRAAAVKVVGGGFRGQSSHLGCCALWCVARATLLRSANHAAAIRFFGDVLCRRARLRTLLPREARHAA
eukprot:scaffold268930_cov33-Tisochrysis_lutea.AAC.4